MKRISHSARRAPSQSAVPHTQILRPSTRSTPAVYSMRFGGAAWAAASCTVSVPVYPALPDAVWAEPSRSSKAAATKPAVERAGRALVGGRVRGPAPGDAVVARHPLHRRGERVAAPADAAALEQRPLVAAARREPAAREQARAAARAGRRSRRSSAVSASTVPSGTASTSSSALSSTICFTARVSACLWASGASSTGSVAVVGGPGIGGQGHAAGPRSPGRGCASPGAGR